MGEETQSNAGRIAIGAVAATAIAAVLLAFLPGDAPVEPVTVAEPTPSTEPVAVVEAVPAVAPEPAAEPEPEQVAEPVPAPPKPPVFDTFRVEPDGSMVVAGRAEPGQIVDIMLSGEALERVTADGGGSFVAFASAGPSAQPRTLTLLADPDGEAISSDTSYVVAPISAPEVLVAQAPTAVAEPATPANPDPDTIADDAAVAEVTNPRDAPQQDVAAAPALPEVAPLPPTVLQVDAGGIRVVQTAPDASSPDVSPNVALDAITYDPEGEVQLSGRAIGDGAVQIYLDNEPVSASPVTEGGDWQIGLSDVNTGVYTLRIDEVDEDGEVVSRIETPFKREEAQDVAAVLAEETSREGFDAAIKTVQPGATLWAIAEENLGSGIFYVEVFEANSDLIKDPNLIYPGQIFRIPEITQ